MTRTLTAEPVDTFKSNLAEGVSYDAAGDRLLWVEILAGRVHVSDRSGKRQATYEVGRHVGAAMPAADNKILLAVREGFALLDPATGETRPVLDVLGDNRDIRFNDAKCDPRGRAFAGTMAYDETPGAATLYRLDPGPSAIPVVTDLTISNGLGWSPDQRTMYLTDTPTGTIFAYDYDLPTGALTNRHPAVTPSGGSPDGMCVDNEGAVWTALYGGHAVHRYTPAGDLDTIVRVPVENVTSCGFANETLFITTEDGGLFATTPGMTGPPANHWLP